MGLPEHPFGLGILEGEESCYLEHFQDHNDPPISDDSTGEIVAQEDQAISPGQSGPSQIAPPEKMDDDTPQGEPHPPPDVESFVRQYVSDTLKGMGLDPSAKITNQFPSLRRGRDETPKKGKGVKRSLSVSMERNDKPKRFPPRPVIFLLA